MTAAIARLEGEEAWDLIFDPYMAKLPKLDQETMHRAMAESSRVWLGYEGDKVLACWGLKAPSLLSDRAYLWLFTTEDLHEHVFIFVRYSQRAVADMLREYRVLWGHTLADNTRAIRWLQWLGAEFSAPIGRVMPFEIRAKPHG